MALLVAHPLAELFPLIEGDDFSALVEDIRQHGVIDRIELLDGQILDGRNRYNVLVHLVESGEVLGEGWGHRAGGALAPDALEPDNQWFRKFNRHVDGDPLPWVLSKNLKRRHLDESQRAIVAAKLGKLDRGRQGPNDSIESLKRDNRARLLNVARASVARADNVVEKGSPELQHAVEQGKVAVSTAETIASLPQTEQAEIVARGEKEVLAAAKEIRSRQRRDRFEQVNQKLAAISESSKPLPTGQRYPIIYADPATRYVSGFGDRSIENHYPTMTTEELCALPVGDLAMKDAVLFIWSTVPQLANTMKIIEAWGFKYVSEWCWDKVDQGTGHWGFNAHEPLLIATRGDFPAPVPGTQPKSLYREKKGDHSEKPAWFAEQIERIWPALPKIELFCRAPRAGWAVWGNQAAGELQESGGDPKNTAHSGVPAKDDADLATGDAGPHAAGVAPGPSEESRAKEPEANAGSAATDMHRPAQGSSRPVDGRSSTATSERMDATAGETAPNSRAAPPQSVDDMLEIPAFLRRRKDNSLPDLKAAS
jgi:N6-adenosine-specific RNA methylase IME4